MSLPLWVKDKLLFIVSGFLTGLYGAKLFNVYPRTTVAFVGAMISYLFVPPQFMSQLDKLFKSPEFSILFLLITCALLSIMIYSFLAFLISAITFAAGGFIYLSAYVYLSGISQGSSILERCFHVVEKEPAHLIPFMVAGIILLVVKRFFTPLLVSMLCSFIGAIFVVRLGFDSNSVVITSIVFLFFTGFYIISEYVAYVRRKSQIEPELQKLKKEFLRSFMSSVNEKHQHVKNEISENEGDE